MQETLEKLAGIWHENGGIIDGEKAQEAGVSTLDLSDLVQKGQLVRVAKGQYTVPKRAEDEFTTLVQDKECFYSHQTALWMHGLVDEPGEEYAVTCMRGTAVDPQLRAKCNVYSSDPKYFELGRTFAVTPQGSLVPAYDLERCVCDVAMARGTLGTDLFLSVITKYAGSDQRDEERLYRYGDVMGVSYVLRCYLDVLIWANSPGSYS